MACRGLNWIYLLEFFSFTIRNVKIVREEKVLSFFFLETLVSAHVVAALNRSNRHAPSRAPMLRRLA